MQSFINEQRREHEFAEAQRAAAAKNKGEEYVEKAFEGIADEVALDAVRRGWKSQLEKRFERKARMEGWK